MGWRYLPDSAWPEAAKRSHKGPIMTAMSRVVADHEGTGYRAIIQTPAMHPGMFSALTPWLSGGDIKSRMLKFLRTVHIFALARDRGSGAVRSPDRISYGRVGSGALEQGIGEGAEDPGRGRGGGDGDAAHERGDDESEGDDGGGVERFVKKSSRPLGNLASHVCSAHQMGSCRMGVNPGESAVDPTGEMWEIEGLYVADTNVFPKALHVNPLMTV